MSDASDNIDFSWGSKNGRSGLHRDVQLYESFTYDGVEYFLYDSVYAYKDDEPKPYIGKLIEIYELPCKARKVKLLWFFYPLEISNYLGGANVLQNEIFLAAGCGKGLMTVNPLEAIAGKCNVVCISIDQRNRKPSIDEFKAAHYVFYRTFDVQYHTISDVLGEKIAAIEVKFLLNKTDFELSDHAKVDSRNVVVCKVDTRNVADKVVDNDTLVSYQLLNGDKASNKLVDNSECDPPEYFDDTEPMEDIGEKVVFEKGSLGADGIRTCNAGVGSLLVSDKVSLGKAVNPSNEKTENHVLKSVDLSSAQSSSGYDKGLTDLEKGILIGAGGVRKGLKGKPVNHSGALEERLPKKQIKLDSVSLLSSDYGGIDTHKSITVLGADSKAVQLSATAATDKNDKSKMGRLVNSLEEKEKSHALKSVVDYKNSNIIGLNPSTTGSDKDYTEVGKGLQLGASGASVEKSSKKRKLGVIALLPRDHDGININKSVTVPAATLLALLPADAGAETDNKCKMGRELISSVKSNSIVEDESVSKLHKLSNKFKDWEKHATSSGSKLASRYDGKGLQRESCDKVCKEATEVSKDKRKLALASNKSSKASKHTMVECNGQRNLVKVLEGTKDDISQLNSNAITQSRVLETKDYGHLKDVTLRPTGGSRWMTPSSVPWEERMKEAYDRGTLVLLQNLDPSYTSREVESIVWHGLGCDCTGKFLPHTAISTPHSGQAFAIFKNSEAANKIVRLLNEECLMLPNGRPLVGSIGVLCLPGEQSSFHGHLTIDKLRRQMLRDLKEAVSTSHFSQPNNLEYDLALNWCVLQKRSNYWWQNLHKEQREDIEKLTTKLKPK